MIRKFNFTEQETKTIIKESNKLLKYHNQQIKKEDKRILSREDECFISGCKGNLVYGSQLKLSPKQLKRLSAILKRYEKPEEKDPFLEKQMKLKEIIQKASAR